MRRILLTASLVALLVAVPLFAQRGGGGRGGRGGPGMFGPGSLLMNKGVQDEIKLTDKQKEALATVTKSNMEARKKAFEEAGEDREKRAEAFKKLGEDSQKAIQKFRDSLTKDQQKRLNQIELQEAGPKAFTQEKVQSNLKLTDKQKEDIQGIVKDYDNDVAEVRKAAGFGGGRGAGGRGKRGGFDPKKMAEVQTKTAKLKKEATTKIAGTLDDNQKKVWKDMTGAPYTVKWEGRGFGGGRRPKGDKRDD